MDLLRYLVIIFAVMFWGFRVVAAATTSLNMEFVISPSDLTTEIIVSFITLACLIFIIRRKVIAAVIYVMTYVWYFGTDIINVVIHMQQGTQIGTAEAFKIFLSIVGIFIAVATLATTALSHVKTGTNQDKKTDWFYKNKDLDRQIDERVDKNNYKF